MSNVENWGYLAEPVDGRLWKVSFLTLDEHHELKEYPGVPVRQDVLMDVYTVKTLVGVTKDFTWYNYAEDLIDFVIVVSMQLERLCGIKDMVAYGGTGIFRDGVAFRNYGLREGCSHTEVDEVILGTLMLYPELQAIFNNYVELGKEHQEDYIYELRFKDDLLNHVRLNVWADLGTAWDMMDLLSPEELEDW